MAAGTIELPFWKKGAAGSIETIEKIYLFTSGRILLCRICPFFSYKSDIIKKSIALRLRMQRMIIFIKCCHGSICRVSRTYQKRQKIIFMQLFKLIVGIYSEENQMANQLQRQNKKMAVISFMSQWNILH